jgi:hypothetical protein
MNMLKKAIRTADDVLYTIGLQRRQTGMDYVVPAMQWLLVGAVIGGCVALLLAPSSGEDLRSQLGEKLQSAREKAREATANMRNARGNGREGARAGA